MKIFVTGSSGFIGGELVNHLNEKHQIVQYSIEKGDDILDYQKLKNSMKGCNIVIHLAAHRKPYEDKTFQDYFNTNCIGTFNVAQAAMENNVRKLIFTSSTSYYGLESGVPEPQNVNEQSLILTQKFNVNDLKCRDCDIAYSTSKVIAEQILSNYGLTKKMQVIILRLGPTRKTGEYRPFGKLNLHLKIENALQAIALAVNSQKELWYEAFTITDKIENVDITKAKEVLGYNPL